MKISEDSHHFVADEILRRNGLEYDPSRVYNKEDEEDRMMLRQTEELCPL